MTDVFTPQKRSAVMARVKGKDTKPELIVRRLLFAAGYRYRLQGKGLPGKPDLVFKTRRKALFVHGCFWHGCERQGCRGARRPKSNTGYWAEKLARNKARDVANLAKLADLGWETLVIWECELGDRAALSRRLAAFLGPARLP
ncbi:MAG: very short patch repair endonuclease [Pseudomonadota bacterium]